MDAKKVSFGFSKVTKKPALLPAKVEKEKGNQIELIKCLEGHEIKLVEEHKEAAPIIIPLKENGKTSSALASLMKRRAVLLGEDDDESNANKKANTPPSNLILPENDLKKRAILEILSEVNRKNEEEETSTLVLPALKADELPLDGAKEPTLDDYESIPIEQYGLAMLRGMGWVEPPPSKDKKLIDEAPMVRPKGMGLGADKALKPKPLLVAPEQNEKLEIKKQAYVRIMGGKHKEAYGQIEGFDDEAGRVIVKMAIGGYKEAFNEFLCQPVSKKEFSQYGKCINTAKYEEYKKLENEHGQIILKKEEEDKKSVKKEERRHEGKTSNYKSEKNYDDYKSSRHSSKSSYDKYQTGRSKSPSYKREDRSGRPYRDNSHLKDGESDDESVSGDEGRHRRSERSRHDETKEKRSKNKKKHKRHSSSEGNNSSDDDSESSEDTDAKRHKHHKRSKKKNKKKTKKSKRQRSRTPTRHRK